ncbi:MAG TPA: Gfo/Idh/MocA family oxidoreductase [Polyangia bacterium]|jgi:predicted dehydrogenase|nr:Gfo/Idh/MocA family oxidoreductase [Polyangia bacterium]
MKPPLRGAIIGYGFIMEKGHAAGYVERARDPRDVEIVAVADISKKRRALAREHLPGARIYDNYAALLAAETGTAQDHRLDFVDIAVPPVDHAAIAHAALDRGLHVLCEKPLATSIDEARSMLRHAAEAERVLYPCHNYKHAPVIKTVRAALEAGRIGKVHLVTLQTFRNTHAHGCAEWRPNWRRERRYSGGGIAMDHGSHTFYLAFEWLKSYPTSISARATAMAPFDTEDDFSCSLKFPTGVASAHLSWTAGVRKVIYTIHGDRGAVRVEDDAIEIATQVPPDGAEARRGGDGVSARWDFERSEIASDWMDSSHVTWFNSLFDDFKSAIDRRDFVGKEAREAFLCVQLITTAYASAREGCRELPLGGPSSISGHDLSDMIERRTVGP